MKKLLKHLLSRLRPDEDLREEMDAHIQMRAELNQTRGMSEEDAAIDARRQFGNRGRIEEETRAVYVSQWVETTLQDIRYTLRTLGKSGAFTGVAVLTLALGVGANAAIFQLLDAIVLSPLPVREPHRLVALQGFQNGRSNGFSYPLLREMTARQSTVEGIFASAALDVNELAIDNRIIDETISGRLATGNYFKLLGTSPQAGRLFTESDDDESASPVVVISDHFWRQEFGAQAEALGQRIRINGLIATVIGVTDPDFSGDRVGQPADFWIPMSFVGKLGSPGSLTRSSVWLEPMARLRSDVPAKQAEAQLSLLWDQLREFSIQFRGITNYRFELLPAAHGLGTLRTQFSQALWLLAGIVGIVVLIDCCNLANLLLARGTARSHEIAARLALGAGRRRILRQLLTESAVLAAIGGGLGLLVAFLISRGLIALASAGETWRISMKLDWHVIGFTVVVSLLGVVIFGLAPALASTRVPLSRALQGSSPTIGGNRSRRVAGRVFIVAQVALSLVLLAGSGLLIRSFWNLTHQDLGFRAADILMARVDANERNMRLLINTETHQAIYRRVNQIPGVQSAAVGEELFGWIPFAAGAAALPDRAIPPTAGVRVLTASPLYTETLGIPVLRGRAISEADQKTSPKVAVISQTAARVMFGSADAIGKVFTPGDKFLRESQFEVVGVVGDFRVDSARGPFEPIVIIPLSQFPPASLSPNIVVRSSGPPAQVLKQLQNAVSDVAPVLRVERTRSLENLVRLSVRRERLLAWLSGGFAVLALVLAAVGLYGVVSYSTQLRAQEIGIRIALAATPLQVSIGLLRETAVLVAVGLLVGISATLVLSKSLESMLFGLQAHDPSTLVLVVMMLAVVGLVAAYLPAYRASRLDPSALLQKG